MSGIISCLYKHDPRLLGWAAAICVAAIWASLGAYRQAATTVRRRRLTWIAITTVLSGAGVWATHYLLMLSYYPQSHASFGFDITALSLLAAICGIGAGVALAAINPGRWSRPLGGLICGCALFMVHLANIFAMHLPVPASMRYDLTIESVLIGVLTPAAAFAIAGKLSRKMRWFGAAGLLVISVMGLHFLALSAVVLPAGMQPVNFDHASSDPLAISIAVFSLLLFGAGLVLLQVDRLRALAAFSSVRAALEHAPACLSCFDRDGRMTFWNEAYGAMLRQGGITPHRGLAFKTIIEQAKANGLAEESADVALAKTLQADGHNLDSFIGPDGRWFRAGLSKTDDGGFVVVATDITEHLELIKRQEEARRLAQAASDAKSAFLANMSHEIRTPLNGVLGMVEIMQRDAVDPVQLARLEIISDSGRALLGILNDVLDLSKIEAGKLELDIAPFDLEDTVQRVIAAHQTSATQKDIPVVVDVDPSVRGAWCGDETKIRQVLSNLVSNAIKFTSRGRIEVRVRSNPEGLAFEIDDSGIGIAEDKLDAIFDSFTQADATTTRRFGGTGLGLSICRQFVQLMGGEVKVESREGFGSTFRFILPLQRSAVSVMRTKPTEPASPPIGKALRLLVAEDNRTNRAILDALLAPLGFQLTTVENGCEAVAAFAGAPFDAVLMDIEMPVMNGVDASLAIRAAERQEGLARTPIIALTANVMRHQVDAYLAAGMDGTIAKPINSAELIEAITKVLHPPASATDSAALSAA